MLGGAKYMARMTPGSETLVFRLAWESSQSRNTSFNFVAAPWGPAQFFTMMMPFALLYVWWIAVKSLMQKDESYKPARPRRRETVGFQQVVSKSKVELSEIVDYLNNPQKFKEAGARLPRGALLVGPSGTGKTLLARAVAGEANCSFLSASASEFVEVFVGRGAARVRDLFRQAREQAPAVLFFDELDALGNRGRSSDGRGANEEYIQTLNQLLTELDGFHGQADGIVVLAATNRYEALDPSLLRPGRFDRHVFVELPDQDERLEILAIHAGRSAAAAEVEPHVLVALAGASNGFSGAELANVINEAIFLALRNNRTQAAPEDFFQALKRALAIKQRANGTAKPDFAAMQQALFGQQWPVACTK